MPMSEDGWNNEVVVSNPVGNSGFSNHAEFSTFSSQTIPAPTRPAFSSSAFGSQAPAANMSQGFNSSSYGNQATPAPTQTSMNPGFGNSSFSNQSAPSLPPTTQTFGSQAPMNQGFSNSSFGSQATSAPQAPKNPEYNSSTFGSQAPVNQPFGVSPFGSQAISAPTPAPMNQGFGTFGSQSASAPVQSQAPKQDFGSASYNSGFGSANSNTAPQQSSFNAGGFTSNTSFNNTASQAPKNDAGSGFGSSASTKSFGAPTDGPTPGFGGSTNTFGGAGFGSSSSAFGSNSTAFGSNSTAFGSNSTAFGSSGGGNGGFGKTTTSFGATSGQSFEKGEGGNRGCFTCGSTEHRKSDCPSAPQRAERPVPDRPCPFCNETGHWKSDCDKNPDKGKCTNCKEFGHTHRECPHPHKCMNCGGTGHYSRECSEPKRERPPLTCHNCQQVGHTSKDCSEPLKPREDGSKPPSTFIPLDENEEALFNCGVAQGGMFTRLFDAQTMVTGGGVGSMKGGGVEKIESFDQLRLGERVNENLQHCGYTRPTPVQQHTMPLIRNGYDVVACAQTGSGKTAAYLLPIISKLMETSDYSNAGESPSCCYPRAVVIVPTRELAVQVYNETRKYAYGTVITCKAVYGGTAVGYQKDELRKGASIVAATIGRFKHFVEDGTISLDKLRFFVLDEVDRLMEQDSEEIIVSLHSKINNKDAVQGIMFSATLPPQVQSQATLLLKPDYKMVTVDAVGTANKCIQQDIECLSQKDKKDRLLALLDIDKNQYSIDPDSTIYQQKILIFVSKKGFADTLASIVSQSGLPATTIHADRLQNERSEAMKDFTYGKKAVMIATAVAERGLDIRGVDHVINYDLPDDIHQYIHRIGRTGRRGNPGRATSFYLPDKDRNLAKGLQECLIAAEQVVPDWLIQEAADTTVSNEGAPAADDSW